MAIYTYPFDSVANGTVLSAANTGFSSMGGAGSRVATTTDPGDGAAAALISATSGQTVQMIQTFTAASRVSCVLKVKLTSLPTTGLTIFRLYASSSSMASIQLLSSGKIRVQSPGFTAVSNWSLTEYTRIAVWFEKGTTTSDGKFKVALYLDESTTPIETIYSNVAANTGIQDYTSVQIGLPVAVSETISFRMDSIRLKTGSDAPDIDLAPWVALTPPDLNLSTYHDRAVIDARASVPGAGGPMSYSISPNTSVVEEVAEGLFVIERNESANVVYTVTGVDAATGMSDSLTTTVLKNNYVDVTGKSERVRRVAGAWV